MKSNLDFVFIWKYMNFYAFETDYEPHRTMILDVAWSLSLVGVACPEFISCAKKW